MGLFHNVKGQRRVRGWERIESLLGKREEAMGEGKGGRIEIEASD